MSLLAQMLFLPPFVSCGTPELTTDDVNYQIGLWTVLLLLGSTLGAVWLCSSIDNRNDTLLYAETETNAIM